MPEDAQKLLDAISLKLSHLERAGNHDSAERCKFLLPRVCPDIRVLMGQLSAVLAK